MLIIWALIESPLECYTTYLECEAAKEDTKNLKVLRQKAQQKGKILTPKKEKCMASDRVLIRSRTNFKVVKLKASALSFLNENLNVFYLIEHYE